MLAKLSSRGRVTLPKRVRQELQLKPGTEFEVALIEGKIILQPVTKQEELQQTLARLRKIVYGMNLLDELALERQREKNREHILEQKNKHHGTH